ncbi:pseudouridine synthase [Aquisalimonas sp.]|uniref:pseudouridine synthase n=1 Tax=unclassified Aquisalimonas TaxID=2644645 RepID=UPI0025BBBB91|nr:pseudouridine synthase [Aquisalimonas sp.]
MCETSHDPLTVLYRDDHFIAIDKPAGTLVHRTRLSDASHAVLQQLRDQIGQRINPVHRLDRPTSGVLLFAFTGEMTRALQEAFDSGLVEKAYLALVRGYTDEGGEIDRPLRQAPHKPERPARTRYCRLRTVEAPFPAGRYPTTRYSLVRAEPLTGRLHQIRRHFAHLRHPIIGDTTHGDGKQNKAFRARFNEHRLMLMARSIRLPHPVTGKEVHIEAPLPVAFTQVFTQLGWPAAADQPDPG